jgi:hypothetical protein
MIPDEIDAHHAVVRVLEEAGIEFVFGMPGVVMGRASSSRVTRCSARSRR